MGTSIGKRQRGITLIGFLIVLSVAGFFLFIGAKLMPVYLDHYAVVKAMKSVAEEPGVASRDPGAIRDMFRRKFDIGYVNNLRPEQIRVLRDGTGPRLEVSYEVRRPLMFNLDFVAKFEHTEAMGGRAAE
jgi:hypothetical protein